MIGDRVKILRNLLQYTRSKIETLSNNSINSSALTSIENNVSNLSIPTAIKLINFYRNNDIICDYEWLLTGVGMTPHIAATDIDINMNSIHESESFKTHNPNAIITTVDNDDMRPIFKPGDLLGAIHVDSLPEQQELYMLSTSEATMIRLAKYSPKQNIIVTATYNSLTIGAINVNDILDCYRVIWWRSFI